MKTGDKVRVIELEKIDKEETTLEIGNAGVIIELSIHGADNPDRDVFKVRFDDESKTPLSSSNAYLHGGYALYRYQLEVIEAAP